jgi:hypothetical protein
MKTRWILVLALALAGAATAACDTVGLAPMDVRGSGRLTTLRRADTGFDSLSVSHPFVVDIYQGDRYEVVLEVDQQMVEYVHVARSGRTLRLSLEPRLSYHLEDVTLRARITMPELVSLSLAGASQANLHGLQTSGDAEFRLAAASHLRGEIEAERIFCNVTAASQVELYGTVQELDVQATLASHARLGSLRAERVEVGAHLASYVTVYVRQSLHATATLASHVTYLGEPDVARKVNVFAASIDNG